jgi:hypothetical protein
MLARIRAHPDTLMQVTVNGAPALGERHKGGRKPGPRTTGGDGGWFQHKTGGPGLPVSLADVVLAK